jgi:transposase InsO family protein
LEDQEGADGYRRIRADLVDEGSECSPELVRHIMRERGLIACSPRPFRVTTVADAEAAWSIPDLVKRDFTAVRQGAKFVGDITYIHTWQGSTHVATVIDYFSEKVVGWSIADHVCTELVEDALPNAATTKVPETQEIPIPTGKVFTPRPSIGFSWAVWTCAPRWATGVCVGTVSLVVPGSANSG